MNVSQLHVIVSKLCSLPFKEKICRSKFWLIIRVLFFAYDENVTIPSRLTFAFAIFAVHILVGKICENIVRIRQKV